MLVVENNEKMDLQGIAGLKCFCLGLGYRKVEKWVGISRLGLVSVSKNHFTELSVSSRSRKIILQNSRSRVGLEILNKLVLGLVLRLEILTKSSLGLVLVSKKVVSSNPVLLAKQVFAEATLPFSK